MLVKGAPGCWDFVRRKTRTSTFHVVSIMAADDLTMAGARASAGTVLTHWGRVTHICVGNLTIIGSDNGLSPGRHQAIIWPNARILSIGTLRTNFIEISIGIQAFSFKKMHLKMSSEKWRPCCLGLNVLTHWGWDKMAAIFQTTFLNRFSWMKIYEFRLKFHWSPINNISALVQIMAWRRPGDKPLSEFAFAYTRPQWVNVDCLE